MSKTTENPQLTKALDFLSNIGDKEYGNKNVILVKSYSMIWL